MFGIIRGIRRAIAELRHNRIDVAHTQYHSMVEQCGNLAGEIATLSDVQLVERWQSEQRDFLSQREPCGNAVTRQRLLAMAREVAWRTLGLRPFDVQLVAALGLCDGLLVEMQTGEGKTLAAAIAASLLAIHHRGVHVLTFNDYLANRDANWMRPYYSFLGYRVCDVGQSTPRTERRHAYASDITYVTAKEAGFDFLRDQGCRSLADCVHRPFFCAIVDEADSILIDEARVPLVIAAADALDNEQLYRIAQIIQKLRSPHYKIDDGGRNASLTSCGFDYLESLLDTGPLHTEANAELLTRLQLALQARLLFRRDVDYLVRGAEIVLIDEFTGRIAENRRWPFGLQAALEAKENVPVQPQGRILNSITLQQYVCHYEHLAGMTGTAMDAAREFDQFYGARVMVVPPHVPSRRIDHPDRIFISRAAKETALVDEIRRLHAIGRPILVGTASVEESERIAGFLQSVGISCEVLNAKNDKQEASQIAMAGTVGRVTISTNMAGRGTDIRLGGPSQTDRPQLLEAGGLYVIGTNRHESRRIDDQLRGRSGRQGEPGETCFFVSLEDPLIARYNVASLITSSVAENGEFRDSAVGRRLAHLQRIIEGESLEIRATLRKYTTCLENQRRIIQQRRDHILSSESSTSLLSVACEQLWNERVACFGRQAVEQVERALTLHQLDHYWSEHLEDVAFIRDGIHLISYSGLDPFHAFNQQVTEAFRERCQKIDEGIINTFRNITMTSDGVDYEREGIMAPSSTWTYMINDHPLGDILDRLAKGIKNLITRTNTEQ